MSGTRLNRWLITLLLVMVVLSLILSLPGLMPR